LHAAIEALNRDPLALPNSIYEQVSGHVVEKRLRDSLLTDQVKPSLLNECFFNSVLSEQDSKQVGLLRAPHLDTTTIKDFSYNIGMTQEAVRLGAEIHQTLRHGGSLDFRSHWECCRNWRVGMLSTKTSSDEVKSFMSSREAVKTNFLTPIDIDDERYEHVLVFLLDRVSNLRSLRHDDGGKGVFYQAAVKLENQTVPLTKITLFLDKQGCIKEKPFEYHENPHAQSKSGSFRRSLKLDNFTAGVMCHTGSAYLPLIVKQLQCKLSEFEVLLKKANEHQGWDRKLAVANLEDQYERRFVKIFASIHYLLAHAMLDKLGSAAKSELFIRALAVAAGFELRPFKVGYVPDLEAFMSSHDDFVRDYRYAFQF
jgi:avirulence protein